VAISENIFKVRG